MLPTPLPRVDERHRVRVLLASADTSTVARVGWIELDARDPRRLLDVAEAPVLDIGAPGMFDDNGVNPCCAVPMPDGRLRLYYVGYQLQRKIPYTLFTGLALGDGAGAEFVRAQETPVLDRGPGEAFFRTAPFVLHNESGDGWEMWYIGGGEFSEAAARLQPRYSLCHVSSADGIAWPAAGRELLSPGRGELGFGRPWIIREPGGGWQMWYSVRTPLGYRIGFATSPDGLAWTRRDAEAGIAPTPGQWDGEMVCYAAVLDLRGERYMLYNGNGYGRTGVGLAVLEHG
ncbi:hypothetical protein [Falsiroseomonas sp. HW251]|uniref:hypothetical protein n=1 Tax=Falsiroseomonas sp. HW251 TaxID=3390998 RepID=UPI003D314F12